MTYSDFRRNYWSNQDTTGVDFRASKKHGSVLDMPYLQPASNLFYNDVWHCPSREKAREIVHIISEYADVLYIEMSSTWVKVDWDREGTDWKLPGQLLDDRTIYKG